MPFGRRQAGSSSSRPFLRGLGSELSMVQQSSNAHQQEKSYRDKIIDDYEEELKEARLWARIIGFLHAFSRFLAFCNLTWASVGLLGAFLPDLVPRDFAFITCLLFFEAGRLAAASFLLRFLMRPLAYHSQDPTRIDHGVDGQYPASLHVRHSSNFMQCLFIAPGFVLPVMGHVFLHDYSGIANLENSLRIFYSFVAFNSLVALVNLICSARALKALNKPPEQSVLRYFDTVLENSISSGLVGADVFEFFSFAYTMLGGEYRRNVQPEAVAKNHSRLIRYLNVHRLGLDALKVYFEAKDPFVQLASVNMVGFWSDRTWGVGLPEEERRLSQDLLTKLADKVGTGQLGWAATTSFEVLAGTPKGARIVAETRTSNNVGLPDQLVNLVDDSSSRSLSLVRALVGFYEQCCVEERQPPTPFQEERKLVGKLEKLGREAEVHRLRVFAAYLLLLMGKGCDPQVVRCIQPKQDNYWFTSEVSMLRLLRSYIPDAPPLELPEFSKPDPKRPHLPPKKFLRTSTDVTTPPAWANPNFDFANAA